MGVTSVNHVADFFIWFAHEHGDVITPLKLQKLVFYADAWYMALNDGSELIGDQFEAWIHGPVVRDLYARFADYKWRAIDEMTEKPDIPDSVVSHLEEVYGVFGGYTAYQLEQLTHQEKPWKEARKGIPDGVPCKNLIDKKVTEDFYRAMAEW
ncbi:DUF4065 domain-containing protein [Escherichia coli]|nr:DUF4065 domain-containing protein [Escherichia coli]